MRGAFAVLARAAKQQLDARGTRIFAAAAAQVEAAAGVAVKGTVVTARPTYLDMQARLSLARISACGPRP